MDYFLIRQDPGYRYAPVMTGFHQKMRRKDFTIQNASKIPERNVMFCDTEKPLEFLDVLDGQLFLVSETVKRVFQMYERGINYKFFCLINNYTGEYGRYYAPILPVIDCLKDSKPVQRDMVEVVREAVGTRAVFRIDHAEREMTAIRLDVAESLLRRGLKGIELKRILLV